jgi:ParB/RepB/Spo0J family partition protein
LLDTKIIKILEGWNVRKDPNPTTELLGSVEQRSVINPIHVRWNPNKKGEVVIIDGERRYRAALKVGLRTIPCLHYGNLGDAQALIISLSANEDQHPLTRKEKCKGFVRLSQTGLTAEQIAAVMGVPLQHVRDYLAALKAAPAISGKIHKKTSEGGINVRVAAGASRLPRATQEKIASRLVGRPRAEGAKIVQQAASNLGISRRGPRPGGSPSLGAVPSAPASYPVAVDFKERLQAIEKQLRDRIAANKENKVLTGQLLIIQCLKGQIKVADIWAWGKV